MNSILDSRKKQAGFTLLELLLSLGILSVMMLAIAMSTNQALKTKTKIQQTVDDFSQARDTLRLMEKDIQLAFHARDIEKEFNEVAKKEYEALIKTSSSTGKAGGTNQPPPGQPPPGQFAAPVFPGTSDSNSPFKEVVNPNRKSPETDFIGREEEIFFATRNAPRFIEGVPQADFIKVGYIITTCRKPGDDGPAERCLVRKTSPLVEGDITQTETGSVLLVGIQEFKLRYLGEGKQDWVNTWITKENDGATFKKFPQAVEVSLSLLRGDASKPKTISMQIVVNLRFPNNKASP